MVEASMAEASDWVEPVELKAAIAPFIDRIKTDKLGQQPPCRRNIGTSRLDKQLGKSRFGIAIARSRAGSLTIRQDKN
jgi:hypothetical protein